MLYFSGTGNSRYAARLIGDMTGDEVISINELLKHNKTQALSSDLPFVFVTPVYAWRIPRVVRDFILSTRFVGNRAAYFVTTCGDTTGNSALYNQKLCRAKGFVYRGSAAVVMPENYVAMYPVPDKADAKTIIRASLPAIRAAGERIRDSLPLPEEPVTALGLVQSTVVNPLFYIMFVKDRAFFTTDSCTACGLCAKLCPLRNIRLTDGKPVWGGRCTHCMACICGCPCGAIEYGDKTRDRARYFNTDEPGL